MDSPLNNAIARCRNLPSPEGIAMRIIALAQDPDTDIGSAAHIISLDAALAGRIMRLANSPLYASRRRIETLTQAMTMLGLHATVQLALGFSLIKDIDDDASHSKAHRYLCKRSILSSLAARLLGEASGLRQTDELMLAGLLQDIGALALLEAEPARYAPPLLDSPNGDALLAAEMALFGCDHAQVGSQLATLWNLPSSLAAAVAQSEILTSDSDRFQRCVALSGKIADIWFDEDAAATRLRAQAIAQQWLDMDGDAFDDILLRMEPLIPEMSSLFNTSIATPAVVRDLLDQANEAAMLRQLREQTESTELREQSIHLQQRVLELAEQAKRDPLTGVANRRHMELTLEAEFTEARQSGRPLSLAFIDLDDFKKINDRHGHIVGDQVLKGFARRLSDQLRASDIVSRFGGEEFVVLFPGTSEALATTIIRRVLELIGTTPVVQSSEMHLQVTFSAGVATHGETRQFSNAEDLLRAADEALYRSKHLGRNCVQAYSQITTDVPA